MSMLPNGTNSVNSPGGLLPVIPTRWATQQITTYGSAVFEPQDIVEVRLLPSGRQHWVRASELPSRTDYFTLHNMARQNIYIGPNPRQRQGGSRATDVALARTLFADFDESTLDEAAQRWQSAGLPRPTMVIWSGHGVHVYLRLIEPLLDLRVWTATQRDLAALLSSDPKVVDAPRVMRLPGLANLKTEPYPVCSIVFADPDCRYRFGDLRAIVPAAPATARRRTTSSATQPVRPRSRLSFRVQVLGGRIRSYLAHIPGAVSGDSGHDRTFYVACVLILGFGLAIDEAWPFFREWNRRCVPPWTDEELKHKLVDADAQPGARGYLVHRRDSDEVQS